MFLIFSSRYDLDDMDDESSKNWDLKQVHFPRV
jgi:hypothetical protein